MGVRVLDRCVLDPYYGGFQIVAAFDDTCVEIYKIVNGRYDLYHSTYMHQFETTIYTSAKRNDTNPKQPVNEYDLTGTFINSSQPIAVYGGHSCAHVPSRKDQFVVPYCDHIVEQIPPVAELGRIHVVPPIVHRYIDRVG